MSLHLKFKRPGVLRDFVKWLFQPASGYEWRNDKDEFCLVRGAKQELFVELTDLEPEDFDKTLALSMVQCEKVEPRAWNDAYQRGVSCSLASLLRMISLMRGNFAQGRLDLLVAAFGGNEKDWRTLYESAPKSFDIPTRVARLGRKPGGVSFLFTLPMADPQYPWHQWLLNMENRASAARPALFSLLPGGVSANFWIQWGYVHPLPDIARIYPNADGAREILLRGEGDGARWIELSSNAEDEEYVLDHVRAEMFEFELSEAPRVVSQTGEALPRFRWTPQLRPVADGRSDRLLALGARIQSARESLVRLETERENLQARSGDRHRFVLFFRQPPETRELTARFRRFLSLSRRDLGQFQYTFLPGAGEDGRHVLMTTEPVHYQEIHTGLADCFYRQPYQWTNWAFDVFVREGYEIHPRVDQEEIALKLRQALSAGLPSGGQSCLLLESTGPDQTSFTIEKVEFGPEDKASKMLEFLNTQFPVRALECIHDAEEELVREVKARKQLLETEIQEIETSLMKEAEDRLEAVQGMWNALSLRIEALFRTSQLMAGHHKTLETHLSQHGRDWREFVETVVKAQEALTREAMDAFAGLDRFTPEWKKRLDATNKANLDFNAIIDEVELDLGARLEGAREIAANAEESLKRLEERYRKLAPELGRLKRRVEAAVERGEGAMKRTRRFEAVIEQRTKKLGELRDALKALFKRLKVAHQRLRRLVDRILGRTKALRELVDTLPGLKERVGRLLSDWEQANQVAHHEEKILSGVIRKAEEEVAVSRAALSRLLADAREARRQVEEEVVGLEQGYPELEAELRALRRLGGILKRLRRDRRVLEGTIDEQRRELADAHEKISLELDGLRGGTRTKMQDLQSKLRRLEGDLEALSDLELEVHELGDLPDRIAGAAAVASGFRELDDREWRRIWRS